MKARCGFFPIVAAIILAVILDAPVALGGEAASPAGFVAGIQGKGYISRDKDTIMISGMDLLYPGDAVQLSKGSKARISLCGSKGHEIRGIAVFIIRRSGIVFKKGKAFRTYVVDRKACAAALDVLRKNEKKLPEMLTGERKGTLILRSRKKSERRGVYVVRGRKQQPVIEVYSERLIPQKPQIFWSPVAGRASYRVVVKSGSETLWNATVVKNSCEYPGSSPMLSEGKAYDVTIEALTEQGNVLSSGSGTLSIFNSTELESLRQDESSIRTMMPDSAPEHHILLGKLYEAHGRLADALSSYEKALAIDRGNSGLKERVILLKKIME